MKRIAPFLLAWAALLPPAAPAAEKVLWRLGKVDSSSHEFGPAANANTKLPVVVHIGPATQDKEWPGYQPATGNGRTGAKPYPFTLAFNLDQPPRGTFFLDLHLLFRQPRVPALEMDVNGRHGRFYFDPRLGTTLGGENDQFNPIHSVADRKLALPADLFRRGENRMTLTAIDDPPVVSNGTSVAAEGDSGVAYDALSLANDPAAIPAAKIEFAFEPTVFFTAAPSRLQEECRLTMRFPAGSRGGEIRVRIGDYATTLAATGLADFGEARYSLLIPDRPGPRTAEIAMGGTAASIPFTACRKWKIYYAPHEHLDIGYTDYRAKVAEVFSKNIDRLLDVFQSDPSYRFNFDGSWIIEQWLASRTRAQAERFAADARAGRIGLNAFYASFVTGYPSFEELTRALYTSKAIADTYGTPFDFALTTDIPSNAWSVPSVLASAGIRYFADGGNQDRGPLLVYGHWNAQSPFWWEGPDGQRVLSFFSRHYHQLKAVFGLPPDLEAGKEALPRFLQTYSRPDYKPDAILLYGTQVENLPMDYGDAAFVKNWNSKFTYPQIVTCRFADYFRYIEEHYGSSLPVVRGGGGDYWAENQAAFVEGTARDRANQGRVVAAEKLSALNAAMNRDLRFPLELDRGIWRDMLLFAEHTYGSSRTSSQPEHDEVLGQLGEKNAQTVRAQSGIDKMMRTSMSQLAEEIPTEGRNLIVYNPLSWTRSGIVRFQLDKGYTVTDLATNQPVTLALVEDKGAYQTIRFQAKDVPSLGYKVYRLNRGQAAPAGRQAVPGETIENEYYRVTFDPARGAIRSIYDKQLSRELVDSSSPYRFDEYIFVTGGSGQTRLLQPWDYLPPAELTVHHAEGGKLVSIERTPWGSVAKLEATALHTPKITTEIRLMNGARRIEIENHVDTDLLYEKMAGYFAFPWAASQPAFRYDIANGWVNPAKDLLEGAGTEWIDVQHWVSVEDKTAAMALAISEAPLVALGDIDRGRWPKRFSASSSTVFSYAVANLWSSKWAGKKSGSFDYHYAVTSAPAFDPRQLARFGEEHRNPLEIAEIKTSDKLEGEPGPLPPGQGSLAAVAPDNLAIAAVKGAEDGDGLVFRVMEAGGRESDGSLTLPWMNVGSANRSNSVEVMGEALDHDAHSVRFHLKPHEVATLRVRLRTDSPAAAAPPPPPPRSRSGRRAAAPADASR